ncbi:MAG: DmsC/YnfH family molybdoenzyme membrane anchor subunit, partial [Verrucomicrobiales bacterium]
MLNELHPPLVATGELTLIDELLAEQRELSAVERFSQQHAKAKGPVMEPHYRDLIPIRKPSSGEQYSFEVDLDKCTGCKACVVACHSLNGLDENESWRDVGTISGIRGDVTRQQTVTSACHHCADPACLEGCPVGAYDKSPETGIVRHLDDQCIGCQYCSLKCPYDVPKYNAKLGIVRKCDMCHDRLAEGEAPACVQSCPNGAIAIRLVSTPEIRERAQGGQSMIAGAFRSDYTFPSTRYKTRHQLDFDLRAADERSLEPSHAHLPLVWMLMLTQVAVGISLVDLAVRVLAPASSPVLHGCAALAATLLGLIGVHASLFHLGSPFGAWRAFLGLKTSWLSREIFAFGAWMPAIMGYSAIVWWDQLRAHAPTTLQNLLPATLPAFAAPFAALLSTLAGLAAVFCSVMVYVDTKRDFWTAGKTGARFVGTMLVGGTSTFCALTLLTSGTLPIALLNVFLASWLFKITVEGHLLLPAHDTEWSLAKKSALIQLRPLRSWLNGRWFLFALAPLGLFAALAATAHPLLASTFALVTLFTSLAGEWIERRLFFQAMAPLKMPGSL